jgi:hypothetical protein
MSDRTNTYNNLIDRILSFEVKGMRTDEVFRSILVEYFFAAESDEKKFNAFMKGFEFPPFIEVAPSLIDLDFDQFADYVNGSSATESLSGKIILSKQYLKIFYQNHPPEFSKIPGDVQLDLLDTVKDRNARIISAFRKLNDDRTADAERTLIRLVALILKNVKLKSGFAYAPIRKPAADIIRELFPDADETFRATPPQMAELNDDLKIKAIIKAFCLIRKNSELADIAQLFKDEVDRYKQRALHSAKSVPVD